MSELQIALIVLAVVLVAAVWFYNLWQERQQLRRSQALFPQAAPDVLMADQPQSVAPESYEKTEPGFGSPAFLDAVAPEPSFTPFDVPAPEPFAASASAAAPAVVAAPLPEPEASAVAAPEPQITGVAEVAPPLLQTSSTPAVEESPVPASGAVPPAPVPDEWGDGLVDCLVRLAFEAPVPVKVLMDRQTEWSASIDKPLQWLGFDEKTGRWRTLFPTESGSVRQLAVALQLVDRVGAVNAETLKSFVEEVTQLAKRFHARLDAPALAPLLERALQLDAFCASVDLQLSLHVLPRATTRLSNAKLQPLIIGAGLRREGERFVALADNDAEAFALACHTGTTLERGEGMDPIDLVFSFDVPRVASGPESFDRMVAFAHKCATAVGGQLTDAHRKPLPDATLAKLRGRIGELQQRMLDQGIPPGSVRALRLFS
jgi:FtsZ-interacting cell division protein ZipA